MTQDGAKVIHSLEDPTCPVCGEKLVWYDRRRTLLNDRGESSVYLLRRLRCAQCRRLHLEAPDFIQPQKHYAAQLIADTVSGVVKCCPADDSTIRRWKRNCKL